MSALDPIPPLIPRPIKWPLGIILFGAVMAGIGFCSAKAAEPRVFVIWDETANVQYHPHQFTSATACAVDIAHAKDGAGKRLSCRRVSTKGD